MVELNVQVAHELPLPTIGMKNVLVVDDVAVMRTIISRVLRNLEVESVQAADGCEAFELLSKQRVNAVITDIEMPNWSGFDLVDAMRRSKDQRIATLPVIVTSTLGSKAIARKARRYVGVYFLRHSVECHSEDDCDQSLVARAVLGWSKNLSLT